MRYVNIAVKILLSTALMTLFSLNVSAQDFNFTVQENSCDTGEEPLISLYNKSGGNVAEPGYYKWQVCGENIDDTRIDERCAPDENSVLSLYERTDSHVSIYDNYKLQLCGGFSSQINNSCKSENIIISLAKEDDSHAGEPGALDKQLCAFGGRINTISLELSLSGNNNIYSDGNQITTGLYTDSDINYPYIVTDEPVGLVSYSPFESLEYKTVNSNDILTITQTDGNFLLPNTQGGYQNVDDDEDLVAEREFIDRLRPSFSYPQPERPTVRVTYKPNTTLEGFQESISGPISLTSKHKVDNSADNIVTLSSD